MYIFDWIVVILLVVIGPLAFILGKINAVSFMLPIITVVVSAIVFFIVIFNKENAMITFLLLLIVMIILLLSSYLSQLLVVILFPLLLSVTKILVKKLRSRRTLKNENDASRGQRRNEVKAHEKMVQEKKEQISRESKKDN